MQSFGGPIGTCIGKESFASPHHARQAAARRPGRCAYRCPYCHRYHVGSIRHRPRRHRLPTETAIDAYAE